MLTTFRPLCGSKTPSDFVCEAKTTPRGVMSILMILTSPRSLCLARSSLATSMVSKRRNTSFTTWNVARGPLLQGKAFNCLIGEIRDAVTVTCPPCGTRPWGSVHVPNRSFNPRSSISNYCRSTMQWNASQAQFLFACCISSGHV